MFLLLLQALTETPKQPQWYEYAVGVIAIPGTILAGAYSYVLIRKTRVEAKKLDVETRKIELEIKEKENTLVGLPEISTEVREIVQPLIEGRQIQFIVLRFILLYLILNMWGLIRTIGGILVSGTVFGVLQNFPSFQKLTDKAWLLYPAIFAWEVLPQLIYWSIFLLFGWPLFRDVNRILGISFKGLFRFKDVN